MEFKEHRVPDQAPRMSSCKEDASPILVWDVMSRSGDHQTRASVLPQGWVLTPLGR